MVVTSQGVYGNTGWIVVAFNGNTVDVPFVVEAVCAAIQP
jgi:hypothetical protein